MKMDIAGQLILLLKDKDILWFIPLSSKVSKCKSIIDKKIEKYGNCKSIMISEIANEKSVILLQNAFSTLEKYIDHVHTVDGVPLYVSSIYKMKLKVYLKI